MPSRDATLVVVRLEEAFTHGRMLAVTGLAGTGVAMAFAASSLARLAHALFAEALVLLCAADLAVAFAGARYRASASLWLAKVAALAVAAVAYVSGHAAGAGEAGQEGRSHLAMALGIADMGLTAAIALHAAVGVGLLAFASVLARRLAGAAPLKGKLPVAVAALALALLAGAPAVATATDVPQVDGVEAAHAPWLARWVVPFESGPLPLALAAISVAALTFIPLADRAGRAPGWRHVSVAATAVAFVLCVVLTLSVSLSPPGH